MKKTLPSESEMKYILRISHDAKFSFSSYWIPQLEILILNFFRLLYFSRFNFQTVFIKVASFYIRPL